MITNLMTANTKTGLFALPLLSAFAVAGCGGSGGNSSSNSSPVTQNTANNVPFIAKNNLQFIDALSPHHVAEKPADLASVQQATGGANRRRLYDSDASPSCRGHCNRLPRPAQLKAS